jgi:hypothetical protein
MYTILSSDRKLAEKLAVTVSSATTVTVVVAAFVSATAPVQFTNRQPEEALAAKVMTVPLK